MHLDDALVTPATARLTLDEVFERLAGHPEVCSVLTLGSLASGGLTESSDYDILLIVEESPRQFHFEISFIDGRMTDLLIASRSRVEHLTAAAPENIDEEGWAVLRWLTRSTPVIDPDSFGRKAKEAALQALTSEPGRSERQLRGDRWWVTYDVLVNRKYLTSPARANRTALNLRFLHSFDRVVKTWFSVRGLAWDGEKKAILHLAEADPEFLELADAWFAAPDAEIRSRIHEEAARRALAPVGGLWPDGKVDPGVGIWERLIPR